MINTMQPEVFWPLAMFGLIIVLGICGWLSEHVRIGGPRTR